MTKEAGPTALDEATRILAVAQRKVPPEQPLEAFAPYLRSAIIYWRLQGDATKDADDMTGFLDATTQRIVHEEHFRSVVGRSFHTQIDAISYDEVLALPDP